MGYIEMKIGPLSGKITVDDAKLQAISEVLFKESVKPKLEEEGKPVPTTQAAQLQAVVESLAGEVLDLARNLKRKQVRREHQTIEDATEMELDL